MKFQNREVLRRPKPFLSRLTSVCFILGFSLTAGVGCGALGEKKPIEGAVPAAPGDGCMNDFGPQVERFIQGGIADSEWNQLWDCTIDSLELFRDYARGADPAGYQVNEIQSFVNTFLITDQAVSSELVQSLFDFKASFFGGNPRIITTNEVNHLLTFLRIIKNESSPLIPFLRARHLNSVPENLIPFADALSRAGTRIAEQLSNQQVGSLPFTEQSLGIFLREANRIFKWNLTDGLELFHLGMKAFVIGGDLRSVAADEWDDLLRSGFELAGPVLAFYLLDEKIPKDSDLFFDFMSALLDRIEPPLYRAIDSNQGVVLFSVWDQVLDGMPTTWFEWNKVVLKNSVRPVMRRILQSRTDQGLDRSGIETLFRLTRNFLVSHRTIGEIFHNLRIDPIVGLSPQDWFNRVSEYASEEKLSSKRQVIERLANLGGRFRPLHPGNDPIMMIPTATHSKFNIERLNLTNIIARHLVDVYATDQVRRRASTNDLLTLIKEFGDLLIEVKLTDQISPTDHLKRTNEADFFTFSSDGDGHMNEDETTYYIAYLISTVHLSDEIRETTERRCSVGRVDRIGWDWQDIHCFRDTYFGNLENHLDRFPRLRNYYRGLKPSDQKVIHDGLEFAGRRYGVTNRLIGGVDIQGIAGVAHFIETVFVRFDRNGNESLNVDESIAATSVFGKIIADVGGISPNDKTLIEAAFTFTLKKGRVPDQTVGGIAELGLWIITRPFWSLNVKRADVYKLLPVLIGPSEMPPPGETEDLP